MYVLEIIYPCIYVIVHAKMQAVTGGRPFQFVIFRFSISGRVKRRLKTKSTFCETENIKVALRCGYHAFVEIGTTKTRGVIIQ